MKISHVFSAENNNSWMVSHCAAPVPLLLDKNNIKIFFGTRDSLNNIRVASCIYSLVTKKVTDISDQPLLDLGSTGFFDDNAIYPSCLAHVDNQIYLYYAGRSKGPNPLYYVSLGLAVSNDGGKSFQKKSPAPIMERSSFDPWMVGLCSVIKEKKDWRMLYTSGKSFNSEKNISSYDIKYAFSDDGINWKRSGLVAIPSIKLISNVAAPSVIFFNNFYHMWYSCFSDGKYHLGYAKSKNYIDWEIDYFPKTISDIEASYAKAIVINDSILIFFSKGRYGSDGIGCITLDADDLS